MTAKIAHLVFGLGFVWASIYTYKLDKALRKTIRKNKIKSIKAAHTPKFMLYLYPIITVGFAISAAGNLIRMFIDF